MRYATALIIAFAMLLTGATGALAQQKKLPYWGAISAGKARMRTGPGQQFPASWLYQRSGLPVKILGTYGNWRKIEDPDGTQGWMQANLLTADRTGLVKGEVRSLREKPDSSARVLWKAEPGVIGRLSDCARGWCKFDVLGRMGYIEIANIWGADAL
jgi:SH3-like domain-containing protein